MNKPKLIPFTDPRWVYLHDKHPIRKPLLSKDGRTFTLRTNPKTDWWRMPNWDQFDGVVYGFKRRVGNGFAVQVELKVDPEIQFDQATIFLHFHDTCWLKAGQEYSEGKVWDGVVITSPYSDWSTQPVHANKSEEFTLSYANKTLRVFLGEDMMREVHDFGPEGLSEETEVFVGVMGCSPRNEKGAECVFREFRMMEGKWGGDAA